MTVLPHPLQSRGLSDSLHTTGLGTPKMSLVPLLKNMGLITVEIASHLVDRFSVGDQPTKQCKTNKVGHDEKIPQIFMAVQTIPLHFCGPIMAQKAQLYCKAN